MMLVVETVAWLAFSYAFVSLCEYQIHRHLMHRKRLPKWMYRRAPYFLSVFESHAVQHHKRYYAEFDYEPDPRGRELNLAITRGDTLTVLLTASPVFALAFWLSPLGGALFFAISVLHNPAWNFLHRRMHIPRPDAFSRSSLFRALARRHYLHHVDGRTNYNIVLPMYDELLGTKATARTSDVREMLRLGYLEPRHPATLPRLARMRATVEADRVAESIRAAA